MIVGWPMKNGRGEFIGSAIALSFWAKVGLLMMTLRMRDIMGAVRSH
jgi:hypothetical protein